MIEQITLKNFKSIRHAEIELRPLNIFIGQNGSGKSNLLSFFHLLYGGANEGFNKNINRIGGASEVFYYKTQDSLEWNLSFSSIQIFENNIDYICKINKQDSVYNIAIEKIMQSNQDENPAIYLSRNSKSLFLKSETHQTHDVATSGQELAIGRNYSSIQHPFVSAIHDMIADWQIFSSFSAETLENIRTPQLLNSIEPLRLEQNGSNIIPILNQLRNAPQYEEAYEQITRVFRTAFPDFVKFDIPSIGGMGTLSYRSQDFPNQQIPARSMSDGQLRFLVLIVLLSLPNPPALIAVDEPEIGLHPRMMPILAELLQTSAENSQIIVTTHSPELVNYFTPEDIVVVEKEDGATEFKRLDAGELGRWLDRYTLGKLWTLGKLEG